MRKRFDFLQLLFLVPALLGVVACASVSPAVVPGPLAEIPSEFSVPESVGIDVGVGGAGASSSISLAMKTEVMGAEDLLPIIIMGPDTVAQNNDLLEGFLFIFSELTFLVDPTVQTFEATRQDPDALPQTIKIDFRKFDFDGDGVPEDFANCTCPVGCAPDLSECPLEAPPADFKPVGFRIWIQNGTEAPFERVMVGKFDVLPVKDDPLTTAIETNPGKGTFRLGVIQETSFGDDTGGFSSTERLLIGVNYDFRDPVSKLNKTSELSLVNDVKNKIGETLLSLSIQLFTSQLQKTDAAGLDYLEKTVRTRGDGFEAAGVEGPEAFSSFSAYMGRFRNDANFWSGSFTLEEPGAENPNIPATCAQISTGEEVTPDVCLDLAIDTSNEDVTKGQTLPPITDADVAFPPDQEGAFPSTPTF